MVASKTHRLAGLAPASLFFHLCNQRLLHSLRFRFGHNSGHRLLNSLAHRKLVIAPASHAKARSAWVRFRTWYQAHRLLPACIHTPLPSSSLAKLTLSSLGLGMLRNVYFSKITQFVVKKILYIKVS